MNEVKATQTLRRARSASPYEGLFGFSRAVRRGSRIVVSGTAPLDHNGETIEGDSYEQAKRCLEIILEAVRELGGDLDDIVRVRVFLVDHADWEAVGRAGGETFGEAFPAATLVVVKGLLDPRWKVTIEADAELAG
ncbi:MAG: RidA family protein [Thermoanaerobaculales bacterium]|jgi:enamine deaminase RidA (YjgF/YER057c/UK114 family)|nr:RidA family protein [Thermoanaerobaculales bacterium]